MDQATLLACSQCGQVLHNDALVCPRCGTFVYRARLEQLANEALQYEQTDPATAARIWQQCLELLPPSAQQYQSIQSRIQLLTGASAAHSSPYTSTIPLHYQQAFPPAPRRETWLSAILKTGGSMVLSILVYAVVMQDIFFAAGFVLLILVHEMGHVIAMRYYGLSASPPIFIPFMGALINLRQSPPNAKVEAIVGIGGPVTGTIGALVCFIAYQFHHDELLINLAYFGFFLNLFNMLPVPPLDGGRVTAAVNPKIWILGLIAMGVWFYNQYQRTHQVSFIMILILIFALPRIVNTLKNRGRDNAYYQISKTDSQLIAAAYLLLGITLLVFSHIAGRQSGLTIFG